MPRRKKWIIRATYALVIVLGVLLCHAALLTGVAELWIVRQPVAAADAVVVLGGGVETRPFAAARLYHKGLTRRILLFHTKPSPAERLGLVKSHAQLNREVLLAEGVPADAIQIIGHNVTSTREEALALVQWARQAKAATVVIPTEIFHTRRVRWLFDRMLAGSGATSKIVALDPPEYTSADWWQHEEGLIAFQNEVIKLAYYRLKY